MSLLAAIAPGFVAFALGLVQGAFMPSLAHPLAAIDLPLIFMVWLTAHFRFREAVIAALIAGLVRGVPSALPALAWAVAYAAGAGVVVWLFTRVFTNRSWPGLLGLTAAAYIALHTLLTAIRLSFAVVEGAPAATAFAGGTFGSAVAALATQLGAVIVIFALTAAWQRAAGRHPGSR